jgi:hypothetical protein
VYRYALDVGSRAPQQGRGSPVPCHPQRRGQPGGDRGGDERMAEAKVGVLGDHACGHQLLDGLGAAVQFGERGALRRRRAVAEHDERVGKGRGTVTEAREHQTAQLARLDPRHGGGVALAAELAQQLLQQERVAARRADGRLHELRLIGARQRGYGLFAEWGGGQALGPGVGHERGEGARHIGFRGSGADH